MGDLFLEMGKILKAERTSKRDERVQHAMGKIMEAGANQVYLENDNSIRFTFNHKWIVFWPYTGWATGKGIKDGRGLKNLLSQLEPAASAKSKTP